MNEATVVNEARFNFIQTVRSLTGFLDNDYDLYEKREESEHGFMRDITHSMLHKSRNEMHAVLFYEGDPIKRVSLDKYAKASKEAFKLLTGDLDVDGEPVDSVRAKDISEAHNSALRLVITFYEAVDKDALTGIEPEEMDSILCLRVLKDWGKES